MTPKSSLTDVLNSCDTNKPLFSRQSCHNYRSIIRTAPMDSLCLRTRAKRPCTVVWRTVKGTEFRRNAPYALYGSCFRESATSRTLTPIALEIRAYTLQVQEADKIFQASEQQMQTVINNVDGAIDFIISAEKDHPNRIDTCRASTSGPLQTSNPLSQGASTNAFSNTQGQSNPFGAPSQTTNTAAFGASSTAAQSGAFGQPSALGQKPSAFGAAPAFGAPSQLSAPGAFGRPSALGQKPTPFGDPSSGPSSGASSGAAAPFSSFAQVSNPFSQPQQQQAANPFGAPSNPPIANGFPASSQQTQQNPFAQTSGQASNPFGSPNHPTQQNPFGATSAPFGAPSPAPANPFGQPSTQPPEASANPFSNASTTTPNAFAQAPAILTPNPFNSTQQTTTTVSPMDTRQMGGPPQPLVNGVASLGPNGSLQHPPLETYISKGIDGRLAMFKGMRVAYKGDEAGVRGRDGTWQKIWFPQGAPAPYKDTEMEISKYGEDIKSSYINLQQSRSFQGGIIPLVPPRREWCTFDF